MTTDDMELVREYVSRESESAFATLVSRHTNLVYSTALRQVRNPELAEEVTQVVFIILARKAGSLDARTILPGWLYRTAVFVSSRALTQELRRRHREQEAYMQSTIHEAPASSAWEQLSPLLDQAMLRLSQADRDALLLRFFEGRNLREVGVALGSREDAAKKRVERALEKLQRFFLKRGVASTTAVIAAAISTSSVHAAPAALAKSMTAVAFAKGAAASGSTLTLTEGALKVMAWAKAKMAVAIGVTAILAAGTTGVAVKTVKHLTASPLEVYFEKYDTADLDTAPPVLVLRPTKYAGGGDWFTGGKETGPEAKVLRRNCSIVELLSTAYGFSPEQMILPRNLPKERFDLLLTVQNERRQSLQGEIKTQFGLVAHSEKRDADIAILKSVSPDAPGLKVSNGGGPKILLGPGNLKLTGYRMSGDPGGEDVAHTLGLYFVKLPVIDETKLTATYDIDLRWNAELNERGQRKELESALRDQLGLQLSPGRRSVEMLVVEKTN